MNCEDQKATIIILVTAIICTTVVVVIATLKEQIGVRRELAEYKRRYGQIVGDLHIST
jgi:hypothetical protein